MDYSSDIKEFTQIPLQNRKVRSKYYQDKMPNRVPVLLNIISKEIKLDKFKYILPKNYSIKQVKEMILQ